MSNRKAVADVCRAIRKSAKSLAAIYVLLHTSLVGAEPTIQGTEAVAFGSLPEAVDALVQRYGYVVTWEAPPYVYEGDLQDEVSLRNNSDGVSRSNARKIMVAKGVPVTLNLPPAANVGKVDMSSIVKQLAQNASNSDHGAHFRLEQDGDVFHIIPAEVRNANGNWAPHTPLFDTPISMQSKQRSVLETVEAVCSALEATNHVSVRLLVYPLDTLHYSRSIVGASNESARTVLTRALTGLGRKLTWSVFYDIPMNSYLLSIVFVPDRAVPAGGQQPTSAGQTPAVSPSTKSVSSPVSAPNH